MIKPEPGSSVYPRPDDWRQQNDGHPHDEAEHSWQGQVPRGQFDQEHPHGKRPQPVKKTYLKI